MTTKSNYSSALTGARFMMYEFLQVVKLKDQGLTDEEVKAKVIDENIFQVDKIATIKRALPYILKRVNVLDQQLRNFVLHESIDFGKVINFYAIIKTDELFYEFINEVIKEKFRHNDYHFEVRELNTFFVEKAEQDVYLASWAESTVKRLKSSYLKILIEMGILKSRHSGELNRLIIDDQIKSHLVAIGDKQYVEVMGD